MKSKLLVIVCTLVMALAVMAQSATQTTPSPDGGQMACCGQGAACCANGAPCCEGGYGQGTYTRSGPMVSKNQDGRMACCGQGAACCTDGNNCCDGLK